MPVRFDELLQTLEWVSFDSYPENEAYVSRATGRIYWINDVEENLPEDLEDGTKYLCIPRKRDLDLGKRLALDFVRQVLPADYGAVSSFSNGAEHIADTRIFSNARTSSKIGIRSRKRRPNEHCASGRMNMTCRFAIANSHGITANRLYSIYRARLDDDQKRQLRDAQLAWIRFRDLSCAFKSSGVKGGSVHPSSCSHALRA